MSKVLVVTLRLYYLSKTCYNITMENLILSLFVRKKEGKKELNQLIGGTR